MLTRLLVSRLLVNIAYIRIWVHLTFVPVHPVQKVSLEPCIYIYIRAVPSLGWYNIYIYIIPSQRGTQSLSLTFTLNVPSRWNDLPNSVLNHLQNQLKIYLPSLFDALTIALSILIIFLKNN